MDETTAVKRLVDNSLRSTSSHIPLDTIQETILCRLPVKSLLRFRCICKPWDSLISKDLKFAKKHLRVSPKRQHLVTTTTPSGAEDLTMSVMSCPFDSLNLHSNLHSKSTQLDYSPILSSKYHDGLVASSDGILCFTVNGRAVLYNPCIRKLQELPYIDLPHKKGSTYYAFGFGYDPFIDNYKVVADMYIYETQVRETHSYTLGTASWKRIKDFPSKFSMNGFSKSEHGIFIRGAVNWLTSNSYGYSRNIVSLDLGKESYQEISLPDLPDLPFRDEYKQTLTLDVMRDCLCLFDIYQGKRPDRLDAFTDVWLMKEYGDKESWIKLIRLPSFASYADFMNIVYISEDNHMLLVFRNNSKFKGGVYDSKNDTITIKSSRTQDKLGMVKSKVYLESLISPS
ncbi:unnamed protein product [Trifolium pratense]|uniref:Uncharacterized protein n=1 Tax=Trifolium pratense TaxID=57577 RepID=A0ACB0LWN2_TRIPR|nr:unnamed protein product [Trifolium pratense]